ncbi:phosphatase PAP2 family protein [Patescibacteria group bacterium]
MAIKKAKRLALFGMILVIFTLFLDSYFTALFTAIRSDLLTNLMEFITDFGLLFLIGVIGVVALWKRKYRMLIFMAICAILAFEGAFILKMIFQVPRPYVLSYEEPIFLASGYAFPSIHTAFIVSLLPFQKHLFKRSNLILIYLVMFGVVFSRIYLGVHSMSDIVAGIAVGSIATYTFLGAEQRHGLIEWFRERVTDKFELRRQTAHLIIGLAIVFLLKLQLLNAQILFIITALGGLVVLFAMRYRLPIIHDILEYFERPHHIRRFPGRGSFFMFLGAALATLIFELDIAMAAIMIMAVGDSVTNIVGRHFGKVKNPFNEKKNIEGTFWGIGTGTLAALLFVPFGAAFWAATISMIIESLDLGWRRRNIELDDNVIIPLVAGVIMTIIIY